MNFIKKMISTNNKKKNKKSIDINFTNNYITIDKIDKMLNGKNKKILLQKDILIFLKENLENNHNLKLNIISNGIHGLVVEPSIKIVNNYDIEIYKENYVSKIINIDNENTDLLHKEIEISKLLYTIDPNNKYFIYPLEEYNTFFYTNLIMKKGYPLKYFEFLFLEHHLYKLFLHSLDIIQTLINNQILNLDVKYDNFILNKNNDNSFNLVMIDFGGELIIQNKEEYENFMDNFECYICDFWPYEVNYMLNEINLLSKKDEKSYEKFIQYNNKIKRKQSDNIKNAYNDLNNNIKNFIEKVLVYELGITFKYIINNFFEKYEKSINVIKLQKIIKKMISNDYSNRYTINKIREKINLDNNNYNIYF